MQVVEYLDQQDRSPFRRWFEGLPAVAAAKVNTAVEWMRDGNLSNVKGVGSGVLEYRIDWGPGYRVYFGRDGDELILLLGGGTKRTQPNDIERAKVCWADYRKRKKLE